MPLLPNIIVRQCMVRIGAYLGIPTNIAGNYASNTFTAFETESFPVQAMLDNLLGVEQEMAHAIALNQNNVLRANIKDQVVVVSGDEIPSFGSSSTTAKIIGEWGQVRTRPFAAVAATASISPGSGGNPIDGTVLFLGPTELLVFVDTVVATPPDVQIGGNTATSFQNLTNTINALTLTYECTAVWTGAVINLTANTAGQGGNALLLSSNSPPYATVVPFSGGKNAVSGGKLLVPALREEEISIIVDNPNGMFKSSFFAYALRPPRIYATVVDLEIDCCVYDYEARQLAINGNNDLLFPMCQSAYFDGLMSTLKNEDPVLTSLSDQYLAPYSQWLQAQQANRNVTTEAAA